MKKIISLFLVLLLSGCSIQGQRAKSADRDNVAFDEFMHDQLVETLKENYYILHHYVEDPSSFGIDVQEIERTFGDMSQETMDENRQEIQETLDQLQSFDYSALSSSQQDTYDTFLYSLTCQSNLAEEKFDYISSAFSPISGAHVNFPSIFSDWRVENEQDVKYLIEMVEDVDDYLNSALEYTQIQEEKGYMCINFEEVLSYCQQVIDNGMNSSTIISLINAVDSLNLENEQEYIQLLQEAYSTSYLQGYQNVLTGLNKLKEEGENHIQGLARFDVGKEYYTCLLQSNIGSLKEIGQVRKQMEDAYDDHLLEYSLNYQQDLKLDAIDTGFSDYAEIVEFLIEKTNEDFPSVSSLEYDIQEIPEDIAADNGIAAYYKIPSLDGDREGILRINPLNADLSSIGTYATVAHEGIPGHMFQYNYASDTIKEKTRWNLLASIAYQEGYATYVEHYSLKYLDTVDDRTKYSYSSLSLLSYDALILCDIGIHYEGWDYEQAKEYMTELGLILERAQYDQLLYNPCVFAPYYVGYEEISSLKEYAQKEMGEDFNDKEFHSVLLEASGASFDVVQRHVENYVEK